ncbi:hypothetical protein KBX37_17500 [Micromonospora sp. U56]|nr:hypothetical protein [Micromonospora sp. U56]MBQ0894872.1 hypothetical protein [Micromonospora sp. U56]
MDLVKVLPVAATATRWAASLALSFGSMQRELLERQPWASPHQLAEAILG